MANAFYQKYKEFLGAALLTSDIKVVLIDTDDYTFSQTHAFLSSIPAAARVATSPNLANKSVINGIFLADDPVFAGVTGDEFEAYAIYIDSGDPTSSRLLAYFDASIGLPVVPNGENINLLFPARQVFTL